LTLILLDVTVTGGTRRFAAAEGSGTAHPVGDLVASNVSGTFDGIPVRRARPVGAVTATGDTRHWPAAAA
jgi:hypothetical protein